MPIPEKIIMPALKDPGMGHFYVSMIKSVLRIIAGGSLIFGLIMTAGILFVIAELLGILEELV